MTFIIYHARCREISGERERERKEGGVKYGQHISTQRYKPLIRHHLPSSALEKEKVIIPCSGALLRLGYNLSSQIHCMFKYSTFHLPCLTARKNTDFSLIRHEWIDFIDEISFFTETRSNQVMICLLSFTTMFCPHYSNIFRNPFLKN